MGFDILPPWERRIYWIGGIGSMFYCIYSFYKECQERVYSLTLEPGIKWLGGLKDSHDLEWSTFSWQMTYLLPLLAGHVFIGHFLKLLQIKDWVQRSLRLLYDFLAIAWFFGVRATLLCLVESIIVYLVTRQRHTSIVWVIALFFTTTLNIEWFVNKQLDFVGYNGPDTIVFFIAIAYVHIRLISGSIEIIKYKNSADKSYTSKEITTKMDNLHEKSASSIDRNYDSKHNPFDTVSIIDFLTYIFYLPVFFHGPILTFDQFLPQHTKFYKSHDHNFNLKDISKRMMKIIVFALFIEFQSHFMFISGIQAHPMMVRNMSVPAVIGLGVWQGQYFHLKYLCLFGIGSVFSVLDGLTPPPPPACISWVYSFSDMWKYFDVGLYNFVKRYIYIPWGGSKAGFLHQIFGAILAFAFICYWHGPHSVVLVWCCGNLIVIIVEITARRFENSMSGSNLKSILGAPNVLRLKGLLATPLYIACGLQVMFFFFSWDTGIAMADKMVFRAPWKTFLLEYLGFYFSIQNAMYAKEWTVGKLNKC